MKPSTRRAVTAMMEERGQRWHRHGGADRRRQVAGKTGTAKTADRRPRSTRSGSSPTRRRRHPQIAIAVTLSARDRVRRRDRGADRQARCSKALLEHEFEPRHADRRALPRHLARRLRAAWPRSTAPRTTSSGRPRRGEAAARALRRGRGVRRALPPRGLERRGALAREHRRVYDRGEWARHLLHRDGVPRRALAGDDRPRGGPARARARDRDHRAGPARRALRAPPRRHPP